MVNINNAFPSDYLRAADLQGRDATVQISHVAMENVGSEHKPIVYFVHKEKGLVLNKTNARTIADMYGPETEMWVNQMITLGVAWVDFQGKQVEAIRVRPKIVQQQQPAPSPPPVNAGPAIPDDDIPF